MPAHEAVQVHGLADFQRELRKVNADFPKQLRKVHLEAAKVVETAAKAKASYGVLAKTEPSIKAAAEQRVAKLYLGGPKFPWAMGAEFGGGSRPTTQQFQPWKGSGPTAGYALYPAIRETQPQQLDIYGRGIADLVKAAFPS